MKPLRIPAAFILPSVTPVTSTPYPKFNCLFNSWGTSRNAAPKISMPALFTTFVVPCAFFKVISISFSFLSRNTLTVTLSPGRCLANPSCNSAKFFTRFPSIPIMTSSTSKLPAAEPPSIISAINTPSVAPSSFTFFLISSGIICWSSLIGVPLMPNTARWTVPYSFKSAITFVMILVGIANP